nr:hypothetical protein [uncultured Flavobacterium sp.]
MAITDKNILKTWYETGDIPTQDQFWAWFDSYWHKHEKIPITSIEQIEDILNGKADAESFNGHLTDPNAHVELFAKTRIIPVGQLIVFKNAPNEDNSKKEPGDHCMGKVGNTFVNGTWNGDDDTLPESYDY